MFLNLRILLQPKVIEYCISRKREFGHAPSVGRQRLYIREAEALTALLNEAPLHENRLLLANLGPDSYIGRHRIGSSMDDATETLMEIVRTDLHAPGQFEWLEGVIASYLKMGRDNELKRRVSEYLHGESILSS